jgi:sortase A
MFLKQKPENLSVEELEKILLVKRRQSRLERFQRLSERGRPANEALVETMFASTPAAAPHTLPATSSGFFGRLFGKKGAKVHHPPVEKTRSKKIMDAVLLSLEVVAVAGLVGVLVASYFNLKELNNEVSLAQQSALKQQLTPAAAPTAVPPIAMGRLPGGHTSPTSPGGAVPDMPPHLQHWVQPNSNSANSLAPGAIEVEPQAVAGPTRIVIPKINVNAPIVHGVGWEDLKKGVGHLPGSANPGERGNMYLAAHNDIYGEIFRYLEDLEVGDEYYIYAGDEEFRYVVSEKRIIDPTDVEVMLPATKPVSTLQTCHPYLVDTHRLIVIGELVE